MRLISQLVFILLIGLVHWPVKAQVDLGQRDSQRPLAPQAPASDVSNKDEVISDPELESRLQTEKKESTKNTNSSKFESMPTGQLRLTFRSRSAVDVEWQDPREEVFENAEIALMEAEVRRSERLRFAVGLRARYALSALRRDTLDAQGVRYELDVVPTAGYVDSTVANGFNVRIGYQTVHMGRFDVYSAGGLLDVVDLRSGPATLPEASEIGQLAIRVDADFASWLSMRAFYLPFFQPSLVNFVESDYALLPSKDREQRAVLDTAFGPPGTSPEADYLRRFFRTNLLRASREQLARDVFATFAPEPSLSYPQGAVNFAARGNAGEIALTLGTALEHLPALKASTEFQNQLALIQKGTSLTDIAAPRYPPLPFEVTYPRFTVIALDGATDIGQVQLGFESSYTFGRTLYAKVPDWPLAVPEPTDLIQVGLRAEYAEEDGWIAVLETYGGFTVDLPKEMYARWTDVEYGRYIYGIAGHVSWTDQDLGLTLEINGILINGPTYIVVPRAELRVISELYVEVGGLMVGVAGRTKTLCTGDRAYSVGCIYSPIDQAFLGLRWVP